MTKKRVVKKRKRKPKKRPERRKKTRSLHVINDHTRDRDYLLAQLELESFFLKRLVD